MENSDVYHQPWPQVQLRASVSQWTQSNAKQHQKDTYQQSTTGQFTRKLDTALPKTHTKLLYDCLDRKKASILAQFRTGYARLNGHLRRIGRSDGDLCTGYSN